MCLSPLKCIKCVHQRKTYQRAVNYLISFVNVLLLGIFIQPLFNPSQFANISKIHVLFFVTILYINGREYFFQMKQTRS